MASKSTSIRSEIMELLKTKFGGFPFWSEIESDIAMMCAELPEPSTADKQEEFVKQLKTLKLYILQHNVSPDELVFVDDEIELYENSKMVSLYEEKDDSLEPSVISGYSRLGKGSEGIVAIPQQYNYKQLSALTNGVYEKTGLVKFYISREQVVYGKIVAEIYEHPQEIPIVRVVESKKRDKDTDEPLYRMIKLFGEKFTRNEVNVIKEINFPFYVYRFITEDNNELILITSTQCEIGDYVITGVQTSCDDYKMLTDSARLPTKLPFFFVQKIRNRIIKFRNHDEFNIRLKNMDVTKENLFDYPFTVTKGKKSWALLQPLWYKWLIWAWLTHQGKGIFNNYPMHLIIIGPKMSGKSLLLNSLHAKSKETRSIFSGSSSTLKHLVPSFKYNPARLGYLAESNRFSFCDEFLRCLINTRTTKEGSQREESVAIMNDLLEHQKREAGSGISRVNVNMTSRIIATTNPIRDIKNVESLINAFDESFLSRWLIYYQTEEHVQMVRKSKDSDLKEYTFKLPVNDWISFLDYLHTFSADYDLKRVEEVHASVPKILSENLNKHYDARHMHHIECLMDGIVKARCMMEGDMSFKANEDDYRILKEVWLNVIRSWLDPSQIRNIDVSEKIYYLPENCQHLFYKICEEKRPLTREQVETIAERAMSKLDYYETLSILIDMKLLVESEDLIRPYFMSELRDGKQSRL
jgi:hypothetical protein